MEQNKELYFYASFDGRRKRMTAMMIIGSPARRPLGTGPKSIAEPVPGIRNIIGKVAAAFTDPCRSAGTQMDPLFS